MVKPTKIVNPEIKARRGCETLAKLAGCANLVIPAAALVEKLAGVCKSSVGAELTVLVKGKGDDGGQHMDTILQSVKTSEEAVIGGIAKVSLCFFTSLMLSLK